MISDNNIFNDGKKNCLKVKKMKNFKKTQKKVLENKEEKFCEENQKKKMENSQKISKKKNFSFIFLTILLKIIFDSELEEIIKFENLEYLFNEILIFFSNLQKMKFIIIGISIILIFQFLKNKILFFLKKSKIINQKKMIEKKNLDFLNNPKNKNSVHFSENCQNTEFSALTKNTKKTKISKNNLTKKNRYKKNMRKLSEDFFKNFQNQNNLKNLKKKKNEKKNFFFENKKFENLFNHKKMIGKGGFGEVYKAKHILDNKFYCIKKIPICAKNLKEEKILNCKELNEVKIMVDLAGLKNVVEYHTSWIEKIKTKKIDVKKYKTNYQKFENDDNFANEIDSNEDSFEVCFEKETSFGENCENLSITKNKSENYNKNCEEKYNLFIQMEYCESFSLDKYLLNPNFCLEESHSFFLFSQILNGIKNIHKKNYIHYDLKPGNIFLHKNEIKIGDFGLTKKFENNTNKIEVDTQEGIKIYGTPIYSAPEQQNYNKTTTKKSDVYSLGIILFELLSNFKTYHEKIKSLKFLKENNKVTKEFNNEFPIVSKFIEVLINKEVGKRPNSFEIELLDEFVMWEDKISKGFDLF